MVCTLGCGGSFVRLAAGPIRAASECTGALRKYGMQLGMLWVFGFVRSYPLRHSLPDVSHVYVLGGAGGGRASPLRRRARQWPAWGHSRCHSSRDCRGVGESTAREDDPTSRVGGVEGSLRKAGACRGGVREPRIRRGGALRKLRRATRGSRGEEGRPPEQVMGDNESQ